MKHHILLSTLSALFLAPLTGLADGAEFDFNGDMVLDTADANLAPDAAGLDGLLQCTQTSSADFNMDGTVNFSDFLVHSANFNQPAQLFTNGDTNVDGNIDFLDFARLSDLFNSNGYSPPPPPPIIDSIEIGFSINESGFVVLQSDVGEVGVLGVSVADPTASLPAVPDSAPFSLTLLTAPGEFVLGNLGNPVTLDDELVIPVPLDPGSSPTVSWAIGSQVYVATRPLADLRPVQPRGIIRHQGRVAIDGVNHNGPGFFKVALVEGNPATGTLWTNDGTGLGNPGGEPTAAVPVTVSRGHYAFGLGDTALANMTTEIPATLFERNNDVHLRLWFSTSARGPFNELTPAQAFVSVPSSLFAAKAGGVSPGAISTSMIAPGAVTSASLGQDSVTANAIAPGAITSAQLGSNSVTSNAIAPGSIALSDLDPASVGAWEVSGGDVFRNSGHVGIGTASPVVPLEVTGSIRSSGATGGTFSAFNPANQGASANFGWLNDTARIRIGGTGAGAQNGFDIQTVNNRSLLRITGAGQVGIGTSSPGADLHVRNGTDPTIKIQSDGASEISGRLALRQSNETGMDIYYDGTPAFEGLRIDPLSSGTASSTALFVSNQAGINGRVGIGTTSPSHLLHVNGVARSTQSTWATSSDARVKENVRTVEGSLERIGLLRPVTFEYVEEYRRDRGEAYDGRFTGFLAQEVKQIFPEMVTTANERIGESTLDDFHVLNSGELVPHLVAAVKDLKAENEALREQHAATLERLAALERLVLGETCDGKDSR